MKRRGGDPNWVYDFGTWALFAGIAGARLWEVAFAWDYYGANPTKIVAVWEGGLSIQGAILGGLIAGFVFVRRRGLPFWESADAGAPGILFLLLRMRSHPQRPGTIFLAYVVLYSLGRFALEFLRGDSLRFLGLKAAQVTSLAAIALALFIWQRPRHRPGAAIPAGR